MALVKKRDRMLVRRGSDCQSPIQDVPSLEALFSDISHLGTGRFSDVALVRCKKSGERVALKLFPKTEVKYIDFIREYNYSYFLTPHQSIVNTFEGLFATSDVYYFVQEYCPTASLREAVYRSGGLPEESVKVVLKQVISALEFMHGEGLVHRNLRAKNVLIFDPSRYERIKITDFALTRRHEAYVKNIDDPNEYHAPELCDILVKEAIVVDSAVDVWAVGIIVYFSLIGKYPWQVARAECKPFNEWDAYIRRKSTAMPPKWGRFTDKGVKIFRKTLKTKVIDRVAIKDLKKYLNNDKWVKAALNKSTSAHNIRTVSKKGRRRRVNGGGNGELTQRSLISAASVDMENMPSVPCGHDPTHSNGNNDNNDQQHLSTQHNGSTRSHTAPNSARRSPRHGGGRPRAVPFDLPSELTTNGNDNGLSNPTSPCSVDGQFCSPSTRSPMRKSPLKVSKSSMLSSSPRDLPMPPMLGLGMLGIPMNLAAQVPPPKEQKKSRSAIHQFLSNTLATMSEISEQVVSATE